MLHFSTLLVGQHTNTQQNSHPSKNIQGVTTNKPNKTKSNHVQPKDTYIKLMVTLTHSWSRALLEKLPIVQLLENFPAFYGTRRFITAFT
jgi:hypothetical protein